MQYRCRIEVIAHEVWRRVIIDDHNIGQSDAASVRHRVGVVYGRVRSHDGLPHNVLDNLNARWQRILVVAQVVICGTRYGHDPFVFINTWNRWRNDQVLNLEKIFRRRIGYVSCDDQHVAREITWVDVYRPRRGQSRRINFGESQAGQQGIAERQVAIEWISLGADPISQVAVRNDVAQEGRINDHTLRELKEHIVVTSARVVDRMSSVSSRAFTAVRHAQSAAVTAQVAGSPRTVGSISAKRAGFYRYRPSIKGPNVPRCSACSGATLEFKRRRRARGRHKHRLHGPSRIIQPHFTRFENVVSIADCHAAEGDFAIADAHVIASKSRRPIVVDHHNFARSEVHVAGIGDFVSPSDCRTGCENRNPNTVS